MPVRLCRERGCPEVAVHRGHCRRHARDRERIHARRTSQNIYQSKRWKATRRRVLGLHPKCADCPRLAVDVHHVKPIAEGGEPYALANLVGLCKACHSIRHRRYAAGKQQHEVGTEQD